MRFFRNSLLLAAFALTLPAAAQEASAAADSTEARTLRAGRAERRPAESAANFLGRVLPASFAQSDQLIDYAWHPSAYGRQLFFSAPGNAEPLTGEGRRLFVLDPISPAQYAVQTFDIDQGDITSLEALFFADANHDGQKDLLTLTECSLRETIKVDGRWITGRSPHYETRVLYYQGQDSAGRPRYEQEILDKLAGLATAAAVRQRLAAPPGPRRPAAKPAKR